MIEGDLTGSKIIEINEEWTEKSANFKPLKNTNSNFKDNKSGSGLTDYSDDLAVSYENTHKALNLDSLLENFMKDGNFMVIGKIFSISYPYSAGSN